MAGRRRVAGHRTTVAGRAARAVAARGTANAVGLLAGFGLDLVLGDPRRGHPVAGFGQAAAALERRLYAPSRASGAGYVGLAVGVPVTAAIAAAALTRSRPLARAALVAGATWAVLGARSLHGEASAMATALEGGDLATARDLLSNLCGRDPSTLDEPELARATVESVAENTSDAVVAPLFWGAVAGLPGLVGYRAVNTLDAMVGHRSTRYARFGTPAARLDDAANLLPSRLTAALTVAAAPFVGGDGRRAARTWLRDGGRHPSPNAGQCESAMAGALGVRLGGRNVYFGRSETRPLLGDGPRPGADDVRRAARLSAAVGLAALGLAAGYACADGIARAAWSLRDFRSGGDSWSGGDSRSGGGSASRSWARGLPGRRGGRDRRGEGGGGGAWR